MSDQLALFNPSAVYTTAEKSTIIQNVLIVLNKDQEKHASTGYVVNILNKLDPVLATSTAQLTLKAIAESLGLSSQQEHQLRVNFLINAFEALNKQVQPEKSR